MSRRTNLLLSALIALVSAGVLAAACLPPPYTPAPTSPEATSTAMTHATPVPTPPEAAALVAANKATVQTEHSSPDGLWRATVYAYPCTLVGDARMAYEELRLVHRTTGTDPLITHQLRYCEGLGAIGLAGLYWSANSRYFYFTDAREGFPDGGCGPYVRPTLRVDAATFAVQSLGSGPRSPDGTRLASWHDGSLVIWDIEAGTARPITPLLPEATDGAIAWSPDGRSLVYLRMESACPPYGRRQVVRVDLSALDQTLLLDTAQLDVEPPSFSDLRWDTPDTLRLLGALDAEWQLDLITGALRHDE